MHSQHSLFAERFKARTRMPRRRPIELSGSRSLAALEKLDSFRKTSKKRARTSRVKRDWQAELQRLHAEETELDFQLDEILLEHPLFAGVVIVIVVITVGVVAVVTRLSAPFPAARTVETGGADAATTAATTSARHAFICASSTTAAGPVPRGWRLLCDCEQVARQSHSQLLDLAQRAAAGFCTTAEGVHRRQHKHTWKSDKHASPRWAIGGVKI